MEQVIIEPDGQWSNPGEEEEGTAGPGSVTPATDDDDLMEIREPGVTPVKQEPPLVLGLLQQTPSGPREQSSTRSTNKRPAAVIDLTGSDEDDHDSPVRPPKRQAVNMHRPLPRQDSRNSYRSPYSLPTFASD